MFSAKFLLQVNIKAFILGVLNVSPGFSNSVSPKNIDTNSLKISQRKL